MSVFNQILDGIGLIKSYAHDSGIAGFELLETQYGEGDAAKSQSIAENYITQNVVGIFGCNEGSTTGTGNANTPFLIIL